MCFETKMDTVIPITLIRGRCIPYVRLKDVGFLRKAVLRVMSCISEETCRTGCWWGDEFGDQPSTGRALFPLTAPELIPSPLKASRSQMEAPIGGHSPRLQSLPDSKGTSDWTPGALGKGLDFPREGSGAALHGLYLWGQEAGWCCW